MANEKMTLSDFFEYWLENYAFTRLSDNTIRLYKHLFKRIKTALGHKQINRIEPKHILFFYKNLNERGIRNDKKNKNTLSSTTIRKYHVLLYLLFKRAIRWQLLFSNPMEAVDPPRYEYRNEKVILDHEQAGKFLSILETEPLRYRIMSLLGISIGLRRSEIFGLQWKHIHFNDHTLIVEQACQYLPRKGVHIRSTKTKSSERKLSIPSSIMPLLKAYQAQQHEKRNELANKWAGATSFTDDFIFTTWNGRIAHPDSLNTWLAKLVKKHGLPKITPHSFRHMTATFFITAGVDLRTVAGKLGHANSTTTQLVYSHLMKTAERETADTMDVLLQTALQSTK